MVKVVRLPLISVSEVLDYKAVCNALWLLQKEVRAVKNKTIALQWEWRNFAHQYSKEHGITANPKEILRVNMLSGNIDAYLRQEYDSLYSANLSAAVTNACRDFQNSIKKVLSGERSIVEYKGNGPIDLPGRAITLKEHSGSVIAELALFKNKRAKELGLPNCRLPFRLSLRAPAQTAIVKRCLSGEYSIRERGCCISKRKSSGA